MAQFRQDSSFGNCKKAIFNLIKTQKRRQLTLIRTPTLRPVSFAKASVTKGLRRASRKHFVLRFFRFSIAFAKLRRSKAAKVCHVRYTIPISAIHPIGRQECFKLIQEK